MRLCFLIPYAGVLPVWMPLFLKSVELNPQFDFLFLTEAEPPSLLPKNVRFISISLQESERRAKAVAGPRVRLPWGYKYCDLRAFYGLVYPEVVKGYDYWGFCDLDLVFGDLSVISSGNRLQGVDIFSADAFDIFGHFTLFRNAPDINSLALEIPDAESYLARAEHCSLDEILLAKFLRSRPDIKWEHSRSLAENGISLDRFGEIVGRPRGLQGDKHVCYWENGKAWVQAEGAPPQAVLYLHFLGLKRAYHWSDYSPAKSYPEFSFSASGFRPWRLPPNKWAELKSRGIGSALSVVGNARAAMAARVSDDRRKQAKLLVEKVLKVVRR